MSLYSRQGSEGDPMHEDGSNDPVGGHPADQRPVRPTPFVDDGDVRTVASGYHLPDHIHPGGYSPNMPVVDGRRDLVYPHLGNPPGGILEWTEGTPGSHFYQRCATVGLQ